MKKPRFGGVWFCLVCQEDVQAHQVEVSKNIDYKAGRALLYGGLACIFAGLFIHKGLIWMGGFMVLVGVPTLLVGGFRRGVMLDYCPCCGRSELIPCDAPAAMKAKQAEAAYQASLPRPMAIRPDLKVTPPGLAPRRRTITA